jgi:hypothetical protein
MRKGTCYFGRSFVVTLSKNAERYRARLSQNIAAELLARMGRRRPYRVVAPSPLCGASHQTGDDSDQVIRIDRLSNVDLKSS